MKKNDIAGLLGGYGWEEIQSKNTYMYSYHNDAGHRMNYYHTTGTLSVQTLSRGMIVNEKNVQTLEAIEKICSTLKK